MKNIVIAIIFFAAFCNSLFAQQPSFSEMNLLEETVLKEEPSPDKEYLLGHPVQKQAIENLKERARLETRDWADRKLYPGSKNFSVKDIVFTKVSDRFIIRDKLKFIAEYEYYRMQSTYLLDDEGNYIRDNNGRRVAAIRKQVYWRTYRGSIVLSEKESQMLFNQ